MKRKKKNKYKVFFILVFLVFLSVYGGFKGGEYLANKLAKPMNNSKGILDNIIGRNNTGDSKNTNDTILSEDDKVKIAAVITEFVNAEHMKNEDKLVSMVDNNYYSSFIQSLNKLSKGEVNIQYIEYKDINKDSVKIYIVFLKGTAKGSETILLKRLDGVWKVTQVDR